MSADTQASVLLTAMAEGIGDLFYATPEWVEVAGQAMKDAVSQHAVRLDGVHATICFVAHNAPVHLKSGSTLAWHARIKGASVSVGVGELPADECTYRIDADHSILSNRARIQWDNRDPDIVQAAYDRLATIGRIETTGTPDPALELVRRQFHDVMAERTIPRFAWMSREWVSTARYLVCTRAKKYAAEIADTEFFMSEQFPDGPRYLSGDGAQPGFWVHLDHGQATVGHGPHPEERCLPHRLVIAPYAQTIPGGRTVNAAMDDDDRAALAEYQKLAWKPGPDGQRPTVTQSSPNTAEVAPAVGKVLAPLHDELSKRSSGELPSDYDPRFDAEWAKGQRFDRYDDYDPSWLKLDRFDLLGTPLS